MSAARQILDAGLEFAAGLVPVWLLWEIIT